MILAIKEVHGTAKSSRTSGFFSEKFGHAGVRARSARQCVGVVAIGSNDVIVRPRGRYSADDDGLLTDVKMAETANLLRLILLTGAFFKTPDQQHPREHLDFVALLGLHCVHAVRDSAFARERSALRSKLMQVTKIAVKKRSLRSELRKNIQLGVALYWGRPTVRA